MNDNGNIPDFRYKGKGNQKYNWQAIYSYYERQPEEFTIGDLSRLPGAPSFAYLRAKATKEHWLERKAKYWKQATQLVKDVMQVDDAAVLNEHFKIGRLVKSLGIKRLQMVAKIRDDAKFAQTISVSRAQQLVDTGIRIERAAIGLDSVTIQAEKLAQEDLDNVLNAIEYALRGHPELYLKVIEAVSGVKPESAATEILNEHLDKTLN